VSVDNFGSCVNETLTEPNSAICEKFASDHPDYYYGGTVSKGSYPKGCFVQTSSGSIMYNIQIDGASEPNNVSLFY
jgi:hypothetical protein